MSTPIPYCEDSTFVHGPVKNLMLGGHWEVPVFLRPRDWEQRTQPQALIPPKPKTAWGAVRAAEAKLGIGLVKSKRKVRASHAKPKHGAPKKKILCSPQELAKMLQVRTAKEIAKDFGVEEKSIYWALRAAGIKPLPHLCLDCKVECGTRKRCDACRRAHTNQQHVSRRKDRVKNEPGFREKRLVYFRDRNRRRTAKARKVAQ